MLDELHAEIGTKRIRYVFTVVLPQKDFSDDALATKVFLDELIQKIKDVTGAERIGVVAVTEVEHG